MNIKDFKGFVKGIDLGGWFSQCDYSKETLEGFITEDDIRKIASWGLDHVRLPIDYNVLEDDNGGYSEYGFGLVENAVKTCIANGLNVVIDIHKTAGYSFDKGEAESGFFDSEKYQNRFYALWEKIAERFAKYAPQVAFELLNEVTDKAYIDKWNEISYECIRRIRAFAPDTAILVGSYWNNSVEAVKDLAKPYDDKIVYNFHCYDPLDFTHQGAYWIYNEDWDKERRISYAESGINRDYFLKLFREADEYAKKMGTILYCGEYGVINIVKPEDTLEWYKAINSVFEEYGIGRAAWSYKKMDFGLSDDNMKPVINELIKYL